MNNKCNKKLLSSILVALSLSSGISINDKIANANYKDEDRSNLNELVSSINDFKGSKENASEVAQNLLNAISGIYKNRSQHNRNSVLYKSMQANMKLSPDDVDISKYKQYGPDALKAMILELGVDKFKGGHFTVWDEQTKSAVNAFINKLTDEINCCDAWFYALGGTKEDIDEYTEKAKKLENLFNFHLTKISNQDVATFNSDNSDLNLELKDFDYISVINKDIPRTWGEEKNFDSNITEKEKVLNHVLKVYVYDKHNYWQGFNFWCKNIIDKPVGCKNKKISEEMEAKIYYVCKATIDKLFKISYDIFSGQVDVLQYRDAFIKNHKNLKLPNPLLDDNEEVNNNYRVFFPCVFFGGLNFLDRNSRIKLLDEIIY